MKMSFFPLRSGPTVYKKGCEAGRAICTEAGLPFTYMGSRVRLMPAGLVIGRRSDGTPKVGDDAPQEREHSAGIRGFEIVEGAAAIRHVADRARAIRLAVGSLLRPGRQFCSTDGDSERWKQKKQHALRASHLHVYSNLYGPSVCPCFACFHLEPGSISFAFELSVVRRSRGSAVAVAVESQSTLVVYYLPR